MNKEDVLAGIVIIAVICFVIGFIVSIEYLEVTGELTDVINIDGRTILQIDNNFYTIDNPSGGYSDFNKNVTVHLSLHRMPSWLRWNNEAWRMSDISIVKES